MDRNDHQNDAGRVFSHIKTKGFSHYPLDFDSLNIKVQILSNLLVRGQESGAMGTQTPFGIFIDYSCRKLEQQTRRALQCLDSLEPAQIWHRGSGEENAIGNLVLHLAGNIRQWIGHGIGGEEDTRNRNEEFSNRETASKDELKTLLSEATRDAMATLRTVAESQLSSRITMQGYDVTVLEAIYHVVEHFAGHTGQIVFATKQFIRRDLGFYRHLNEASLHGERVP